MTSSSTSSRNGDNNDDDNNNNNNNNSDNNNATFFTRLSGLTSIISASSMIRYIILIFLVGLVTVLYFATTQQVLKPSGVGPLIAIDNFYEFDPKKNSSSELTTDNQQTFDSNKVAHLNSDYYTLKDYVQGILYDRGDGCNKYDPYSPEQKPANAISPVLPPANPQNKFIGLVTSNTTNCSIDDKINRAIEDGVSGVIIIAYNYAVNNARIPVFSINLQDSPKITQSLQEIYNSFSNGIKDNLPYRVLRASLRPYQSIIVSSWLFAMFAVGGILVISFFVSILIHMRLYRMRRNQQDEMRRQRDAEDLMGMKKWTLGKEIVNTFPVIIYQKKKKIVNDNDDSSVNNDNDSDKNSNKDNSSTATGPVASINRTASMKSIRSTRSTRSIRSINAINNATNLYNNKSKEEHIISMEESSSSIDKVVVVKIDDVVDDDDDVNNNSVKNGQEKLNNDNDNNNNNDKTKEEDSDDDDLTCAICLEDYDNGDEIRELPCKHWFHVECIDPWLINKSSSCPLCKKDCNLASSSSNTNNEDEPGDGSHLNNNIIDNNSNNTGHNNIMGLFSNLERFFRRNRSASGNNNSNNESLRLENINRTTS